MTYSRWVWIGSWHHVVSAVPAAGLIQQKEACRGFPRTRQANQQEPLGRNPRSAALASLVVWFGKPFAL